MQMRDEAVAASGVVRRQSGEPAARGSVRRAFFKDFLKNRAYFVCIAIVK